MHLPRAFSFAGGGDERQRNGESVHPCVPAGRYRRGPRTVAAGRRHAQRDGHRGGPAAGHRRKSGPRPRGRNGGPNHRVHYRVVRRLARQHLPAGGASWLPAPGRRPCPGGGGRAEADPARGQACHGAGGEGAREGHGFLGGQWAIGWTSGSSAASAPFDTHGGKPCWSMSVTSSNTA
jgi:hypothetical protein